MSDALTTLITFLLRTSPTVLSVELLGSWDNFSKPYSLKQDRRTGEGHWRGCHVFENITCDGDPSTVTKARRGALMMGGRYWYYYRLNGDMEYHDPAEPSTSTCPLLPGQPVNILDVPMQTDCQSNRQDSIDSKIFTLDPQDKYLPPGARRSTTGSVIDQGKALLRNGFNTPLSRSSRHSGRPDTPQALPPMPENSLTSDKQHSLRSIFQSIRKTKSAGNGAKRPVSWHRKVFSRAGSVRKISPSEDIPAVPKIPADIAIVSHAMAGKVALLPYRTAAGSHTKGRPIPLAQAVDGLDPASRPEGTTSLGERQSLVRHDQPLSAGGSLKAFPRELEAGQPLPASSSPESRTCVGHSTSTENPQSQKENSPEHTSDDSNDASPGCDSLQHSNADVERSQDLMNDLRQPLQGADPEPRDSCASELASSYSESHLSSYATENNFSTGPASSVSNSGKMSPILSQPDTPVMSEFAEDDLLSWKHDTEENLCPFSLRPPSRAPPPPPPPPHTPSPTISKDMPSPDPLRALYPPLSGFQGYSLPERELGSSLTLRKPQSATVSHNSDRSLRRQTSKQDLVQSWNDGSEHHMSALAELIGDLGYLGQLIK